MKAYLMIALSVGAINKIYESGDIVMEDCFPTDNIKPLVEQGFMRPLTESEQSEFEEKEESNLEKKELSIEEIRKMLDDKSIRYGKNEPKESLVKKLEAIS